MEQKEKKRRKKKSNRGAYYDYNLLAIVILLICFGLIMLYSTSAYEAQMKFHGDDMYYFRRQALISVGAIAVAIFISKWDYHLMIPFAGTLYLISVVLMAMVRFTPFGVEAYGSRRWLKLGIQFQPAEIAKIAIIIYMPILVIKMGKQVKQLRAVIWLLIFGIIQAGAAFVFTDNLSTGMIIGGIAVVMIFIAHPKTKPFVVLALGTSVVAGSVIAYMGMTMTTSDNFRIRRILSWLHPEANMSSGGYQVLQGLYAIGSGGFFGKGLGNSAQKLGTIPEAQNDMIFSIVCEELGVCGIITADVWVSVIPAVFYRAECAGPLWNAGCDRNLCTYCITGNPEPLRSIESDAYNRYHASICQLRRYVDPVFDGRDGNCPECVGKDPDDGRRHHGG